MTPKFISLLAALASAAALAGCGSSSGTGHAPSHTTTASQTTTSSTTQPSNATTIRLTGSSGKKATVSAFRRFTVPHHHGPAEAHIAGIQGLSLNQKINVLLVNINQLWQAVFTNKGASLPAPLARMVTTPPATCGSSQISDTSLPEYCASDVTILLPESRISSSIEPLGDSALLLLLSDLYSYHVENELGLFGGNLSGAQLETIDSCLSGIYFDQAQGENLLQPSDETGVNALLAKLGSPSATAAGGASTVQLTEAFNKGIEANYSLAACVPAGA